MPLLPEVKYIGLDLSERDTGRGLAGRRLKSAAAAACLVLVNERSPEPAMVPVAVGGDRYSFHARSQAWQKAKDPLDASINGRKLSLAWNGLDTGEASVRPRRGMTARCVVEFGSAVGVGWRSGITHSSRTTSRPCVRPIRA